MATLKRWIVRAWRWKVEVRPLPNLLGFAAGGAAAAWLPTGALRSVQTAMHAVIAVLAVVLVVMFASAWRQSRKRRKARERGGALPARPARGDEHLAQLSPGHEPPEVVDAFGMEIARRLNEPGRKGQAQ